MWLLSSICCLVALPCTPADEPARPPTQVEGAVGLPRDFLQIVEMPAVKIGGETLLTGAKLKLWVEQGWLIVQRETPAGDLEWYIVLAQANNPMKPQIRFDWMRSGLELQYGHYFVRDTLGALRVFRERKTIQSPAWPKLPSEPRAEGYGFGGVEARITGWKKGDWCWAVCGLPDREDVWLRLNHIELPGSGRGFQTRGSLTYMFFGRTRMYDEGDLLVAERAGPESVEQELRAVRLRREMGDKPAPAMHAKAWFNTPDGLSLEKLHGKVVLLDFWGTWCGPCVKKLPLVEALHRKFKDQGLVVIGIHSAQDSEKVGDFLKETSITFPIAIDQNETAKNYAISSWPTYFLINRAGKVIWGFSADLPKETQIEELLR